MRARLQIAAIAVLCLSCNALLLAQAAAPAAPKGVVIEAEDLKPQGEGWKVVMNGQGNYMVDIIGFQHISGEHLLSAPADAKDAKAVGTVQIPEAGDYRVWARYETPTNTQEQFRVEIRQAGRVVASAVMGEKDAPKYWYGGKTPIGQYNAPWGSEGLADQCFDAKGLAAGPAEITLVALEQPEQAANRNVDFIFLTRDLSNAFMNNSPSGLYPLLDAALPCIPVRYYVRLTSPVAGDYSLGYANNRSPWGSSEPPVKLEAGKPSTWVPLTKQDVCHFTTLAVSGPGPGLDVKVELAGSAGGTPLFRAIDCKDPQYNGTLIGLPPYPGRYPNEKIVTVEEQYKDITAYLKSHPTKVGRDPKLPLAWGGYMPIWQHGRVGDAAADVYYEIGMRVFLGFQQPPAIDKPALAVARERFAKWGLTPSRSIAIGAYRLMPTPENVAAAKKAAVDAGVLPLVQRFDYGDEIGFGEWLGLLKPEEIKAKFAQWQQKKHGKVQFETPDSSAAASKANGQLFADSMEFYEDVSIAKVAELAQAIPQQLGPEVLYGANVGCHPFYYPEIAKYIKWFRGGAANFGRHSEYFWQIGNPGPLVNAYIADYFRCGMRDNPKALFLQYTMPHSPGNSEESFRRSAFSHLAHGARGLDYFGIGVNHSFTENYIDFRDAARFAAIRDVNRSIALIEDILPESRVAPSQVAIILSDSTERWDFAGIAGDKANLHVFGNEQLKIDAKNTRLTYHWERVGIYYALVHASRSPDLLIEEDVIAGKLKDYKVAYWVGDCADPKLLKPLEDWVSQGGRLVATAGAMRYDSYRKPLPAAGKLLGVDSGTLEEKTTYVRPQTELPFLKPLDFIGEMPVLAVIDRVKAAGDAKVVATFKSGSPAVIERTLGKGKITFIAALPGLSYLWSAYQPPPVPARGPSSHVTFTHFNADAGKLILESARDLAPQVEAEGALVDARLLVAPKGYAVPLANYSVDVNKPVTLTLRGVDNVKKITSAAQGELKFQQEKDGSVKVQYVTGLGDILRIDR